MVNIYDVDIDDLFDRLKSLNKSNFEEVLFLFRDTEQHIPHGGSQSEKAQELIKILQQSELALPCLKQYLYKSYPYPKLRNQLQNKLWQGADHTTVEILHLILGLTKQQWMKTKDLDCFCKKYSDHLILINQLWVKYSQDKFGFSVQKKIFSDCNKNWLEFGKKVGWYKQEKRAWMDYEDYQNRWKDAPKGYFPLDASISGENWNQYKDHFSYFMSILEPIDL